jgi:peptide deformylase
MSNNAAMVGGQGTLPERAAVRQVEGFHARVVQHEVDHLDGVLYPMRMRNLDDFGFEDTLFPGGAALPPD